MASDVAASRWAPLVRRLRTLVGDPLHVLSTSHAGEVELAGRTRFSVGALLLFAELRRAELTTRAAATAYAFIFALIPLFTTTLAFFTAFPGLGGERDRIERLLFSNLLPGAASNVEKYIELFAARAAAAGTVSSLVFFVLVLLLFRSVEDTFNRVWKAERARTWAERLTLLAVFLVVGALAGTALVIVTTEATQLARRYPELETTEGGLVLQRVGFFVLSLVVSWALFVLPNKWLPNARVRWVPALVGGMLAGTLWHFLKDAFTWYVTEVASYQNVYGTVAILPVLFLWIYLTVLLLLLGGAVAFVVQNQRTLVAERRITRSRGPQRAWHAVSLLSILARAFERQEPPLSAVELARRLGVGQYVIAESVRPLCEAGAVLAIPGGTEQRYALGVPAEKLTVARVVALTTGESLGVPESGPQPLLERVGELFERARTSEGSALEAVTIADLAKEAPGAQEPPRPA
jgi:YihY family inner membrane protein